jgi:cullin-4
MDIESCVVGLDATSVALRGEQVCDAHIDSQLCALTQQHTMDPVVFLEHMSRCWEDHCDQMLTIRSIFLYLDRTYVISTIDVRSLFDMGLQLFRGHLAAYPTVQDKTVQGLLRLIELERKVEALLFSRHCIHLSYSRLRKLWGAEAFCLLAFDFLTLLIALHLNCGS